jgi:hypothetical protein
VAYRCPADVVAAPQTEGRCDPPRQPAVRRQRPPTSHSQTFATWRCIRRERNQPPRVSDRTHKAGADPDSHDDKRQHTRIRGERIGPS